MYTTKVRINRIKILNLKTNLQGQLLSSLHPITIIVILISIRVIAKSDVGKTSIQ